MELSTEEKIEALELEANREDITIPHRLATIYKIYELRGLPKWVYKPAV